jgi:flavin-dependent dehydrogenase
MFDVIVVGAGPGGSVAAKRCAQHGLKTLLLEARKLPRNKMCSGLIMSHMAQGLITQEFGEIPCNVLTMPSYLSGIILHVIGVGTTKVLHKMPVAWRRNLDYWMNQKVTEAGVELWDNARVKRVIEDGDSCAVTLGVDRQEQEIKARFVIGADGATSAVRRSLFPNFGVQYIEIIQECYDGELNVEKGYAHFFYFPEFVMPSFDVLHKENVFLVDVMAKAGRLKKLNLAYKAKNVLARYFGFDLERKPIWTDKWVMPFLYKDLTSGLFSPCKGNILLVGEAGGLLMPVQGGDGIREALWSGCLAAASVIKAAKYGEKAEKFYRNEVASVIGLFRKLYPLTGRIKEQAGKAVYLVALRALWEDTLNIDLSYLVETVY